MLLREASTPRRFCKGSGLTLAGALLLVHVGVGYPILMSAGQEKTEVGTKPGLHCLKGTRETRHLLSDFPGLAAWERCGETAPGGPAACPRPHVS